MQRLILKFGFVFSYDIIYEMNFGVCINDMGIDVSINSSMSTFTIDLDISPGKNVVPDDIKQYIRVIVHGTFTTEQQSIGILWMIHSILEKRDEAFEICGWNKNCIIVINRSNNNFLRHVFQTINFPYIENVVEISTTHHFYSHNIEPPAFLRTTFPNSVLTTTKNQNIFSLYLLRTLGIIDKYWRPCVNHESVGLIVCAMDGASICPIHGTHVEFKTALNRRLVNFHPWQLVYNKSYRKELFHVIQFLIS
jgi:hypothetical protein